MFFRRKRSQPAAASKSTRAASPSMRCSTAPMCCAPIPGSPAAGRPALPRALDGRGHLPNRQSVARHPPDLPQIRDETIRGHVFCSFLALVLRKELQDRLAAAGHSCEWADIVQDLERLSETEIEQDGKRYPNGRSRGFTADLRHTVADRSAAGTTHASMRRQKDQMRQSTTGRVCLNPPAFQRSGAINRWLDYLLLVLSTICLAQTSQRIDPAPNLANVGQQGATL